MYDLKMSDELKRLSQKVESYVQKLNFENVGRIRARFYVYDESNSEFSDFQRLTDPQYEEESTIENWLPNSSKTLKVTFAVQHGDYYLVYAYKSACWA